MLSLCCPLKNFCLWTGPVVKPDPCPQPTAGAIVELVCMVIFPYLSDRSHFGVVLDPVRTAFTLPGLWHHFGWAQTKKILVVRQVCRERGGGTQCANKVCAGPLQKVTRSCLGKHLLRHGWRGQITEAHGGRAHC